MCNHCYHKYGRNSFADACPHPERLVYAKGKCQNCYLNDYNKYKRRQFTPLISLNSQSLSKSQSKKVVEKKKKNPDRQKSKFLSKRRALRSQDPEKILYTDDDDNGDQVKDIDYIISEDESYCLQNKRKNCYALRNHEQCLRV